MKKPNILFCIADDQSWPHAGAYGCRWVKTPGFDRVAEEGILFNNAFTPNSKCAPSRASIVTGRYSWQLEEAANHICFFPSKYKSFIEILGENGYETAYTGKGVEPVSPGKKADGSRRELTGRAYHDIRLTPPTNSISAKDYAANFRKFMEERDTSSPFMFWYGGHEPHRRYEYGSGIKKGGKRLDDIDEIPPYWPDNTRVRNDMLDYAFEVEWFDKQLVKILDILEEKGELDNTIVFVTSDNGMPFPRLKGQQYEEAYHEPLAVMWKNVIKPGRISDDLVNFVDFAPTILEAAGMPLPRQITGKSLLNIFKNDRSGIIEDSRTALFAGKERHDLCRKGMVGYPIRAIRTHKYLYLHNFEPKRWPAGDPGVYYRNIDDSPTKTEIVNKKEKEGKDYYWKLCMGKRPAEELYDIEKDVHCINNLAYEEKYIKIKNELWEKLQKTLREHQDPRIEGKGDIFDRYPSINPFAEKMVEEMFKTADRSTKEHPFKKRNSLAIRKKIQKMFPDLKDGVDLKPTRPPSSNRK